MVLEKQISQLANFRFVAPKSVTVDQALYSVGQGSGGAQLPSSLGLQSSTSSGMTPTKYKSESSLLHTLSASTELDSPESGFVESPTADKTTYPPPTASTSAVVGSAYRGDPERESISSQSSLEITVNS